MDEKVVKYLQKVKRRELFKRGLFETRYYNDEDLDEDSKKKLRYDYDKGKYYEYIYADVSDSEFDQLMKYPHEGNDKKDESSMPSIFNFIGGFIMVVGGIYGFILFTESPLLGLAAWLSAFISGMLFLGFGKVISLLEKISNK